MAGCEVMTGDIADVAKSGRKRARRGAPNSAHGSNRAARETPADIGLPLIGSAGHAKREGSRDAQLWKPASFSKSQR